MRQSFIRLSVAVVCVVVCGCSHKDSADVAGQTAKVYYEQLLAGDYAAFADGIWHSDSISDSYRRQLIQNAESVASRQKSQRGGITGVEVSHVETDSARHEANVYLMFKFSDNTKEKILVPMKEHEGTWYLR